MTDPLSTWKDGAVKDAILAFVEQASTEGSAGFVPVEERVAVFDNDGTLWCEKPMPIQLDFILRRFAEMAEPDPYLRERQPWKAAHARDYPWLAGVMDEHYAGDDTNVKTVGAGIVAAFANITVDAFEEQAAAFRTTPAIPHWSAATSSALSHPWWSSSRTYGRTASRTTSPRAGVATSCDRSARRSTAFPGRA